MCRGGYFFVLELYLRPLEKLPVARFPDVFLILYYYFSSRQYGDGDALYLHTLIAIVVTFM